MKNWFFSLAPRERVMVATAAVFTMAALFYVAVWQPLHQGADELETRIASQRELATRVTTLGAEAEKLRSSSRDSVQATDDSLLSVIDRSSRDADMDGAVKRIQPEGDDQAAVTVEGAGFNAMIRWLRELQQTYGVTVSALNVTRGEDDGVIQARMTLERGA